MRRSFRLAISIVVGVVASAAIAIAYLAASADSFLWRGIDIVWIQQMICSYSRLPFLPKSPTSVLHQPAQFRLRGSSRELAQPLRRLSGLATQVRRDRPQRITIQPPHSGNIYVRKYYMRAY